MQVLLGTEMNKKRDTVNVGLFARYQIKWERTDMLELWDPGPASIL